MSTFTTSREFPASPEAVFAALAAPSRLAKWWGPTGFRNTFDTFEVQPGGQWRFTMHGPDGTNYPNESTFVAIEPARKVVIRHEVQPYFQLTITLAPTAGGTLVTWVQAFDDPQVAAAVRHIVEPANEQGGVVHGDHRSHIRGHTDQESGRSSQTAVVRGQRDFNGVVGSEVRHEDDLRQLRIDLGRRTGQQHLS